jgi:predicted cupin superfamily sugar epimerase
LINPDKRMPDSVTAEEIRDLLKLEPNRTCGYVRETYKSDLQIAPGGLPAPFADGRPVGTALYFMVTPQAPVKLHRIDNDQLYHYYLGDPIEVLLLRENGDSELVIVGPNIVGGHLVQLSSPAAHFIPRASPASAAGSSAAAPNGLAWWSGTEMSSLAMPTSWPPNIRKPPPTSAPSLCGRKSSRH